MSQLPITAYFNTCKRQMYDKLHGKSKLLLLERDHSNSPALTHADSEQIAPDEKANLEKTSNRLGTRAMRSHALSATDGWQPNIRDSLLKTSRDSETKKVPFAKKWIYLAQKKS
ncbi:hypothetical protein EAG_07323 [Camponotus floridanus]|uniref:Uncharacterized protein n=1 Tax=Camponotus floridanus TaxID=104421 RepID=E2AFD2_CAMFO|nr:hypothetical protein EAG_07323 [Camponotus floridanus]